MATRYPLKTYTRKNKKESYASKAFDDLFNSAKNKPVTERAGNTGRWSTQTYAPSRSTVDAKRRRLNSDEDPYSFDEGDKSPNKLKNANVQTTPKKVTRSSSQNNESSVTPPKVFYGEQKNDFKSTKSYHAEEKKISKIVSKTDKPSSLSSRAEGTSRSVRTNKSTKSTDSKKQMSIDSFTRRTSTSPSGNTDHQYAMEVSPPTANSDDGNVLDTCSEGSADSEIVFNFKTSSNDRSDHNYSTAKEKSKDVKTVNSQHRPERRSPKKSTAKSTTTSSTTYRSSHDKEEADSSSKTRWYESSPTRSNCEESSPVRLISSSPLYSQNSKTRTTTTDYDLQSEEDTSNAHVSKHKQTYTVKNGSKSSISKTEDVKNDHRKSTDSDNKVEDDSKVKVQTIQRQDSTKVKVLEQDEWLKLVGGKSSYSKSNKGSNKIGSSSTSSSVSKKEVKTKEKEKPKEVEEFTFSDSDDNENGQVNGEIVVRQRQELDPEKKKLIEMRNQKLQQMDRIKEPKFGPATKRLLSSPKKVSPNLPGTGKAVYNARPWAMTKAASVGDIGSSQESQSSRGASSSAAFTPDFDEDLKPPPKLHRTTSLPKKLSEPQAVTSLKVQREYKQLFTVVRNVKEAHECQEHGETQEFFDDIEYLLDGLRDVQSPSTRCLSCMGLATKSAMAAFRMHLRAHGVVTRIFTALHDACSHPSLALATATVMHMLSRDRLNMDLDKESLELMVKLLSVDAQYTSENVSADREYQKTREKVTELLTQIKKEGGAKHLDLTDISTGKLAMESMLSLTSRKAGEWFKEELRALGGLDYFVQSVADCVDYFIMEDEELSESHVDKLRTIDRCLRVLENVTFMNTENQTYLIGCKNSTLITALCRGLKVCEGAMSQYTLSDTDSKTVDKNSTGYIIFHTLLSILRVLLNITHDNEFGSTKVGSQHGLLSTVLLCILQIPKYAPSDQKFDLLVLGLGLLINLVEHCDINRRLLMSTETVSSYDSTSQAGSLEAPEALVQLFLQRDEAARNAEAQDEEEADTSAAEGTSQETVDKSGEWRESESGIEWVVLNEDDPAALSDSDDEMEELPSSQDENDPLTKALHKAGKHMEDSIVASYVSLLIGCIIQNNKTYVERIQSSLPENGFDSMVKLLYKFLGFMNLTEAVGNSGGTSIKKVIDILESC